MDPIVKNSNLQNIFSQCKSEGRACFVAYVCAGDPDFNTSLEVCKTLIKSGIDVLELGVPFSDPLADGLTNQLAAQRSLDSGMTGKKVFQLVQAIRKFSQIPIVFYTYYNLVFSAGIEIYSKQAKQAGVDALLTLDLPPEEANEYLSACKEVSMETIFIVAPTTPEKRIKKICESTTGFIYYVSREGVTGEQAALSEGISDRVQLIKRHTCLPVVVGFGVSNSIHVRNISSVADGVVVGSSIVKCIAENPKEITKIKSNIVNKINFLLEGKALWG